MAKEVKTQLKLNLAAGEATPAPPVGPALGQHGVPIMEFIKEYNARGSDYSSSDYCIQGPILFIYHKTSSCHCND